MNCSIDEFMQYIEEEDIKFIRLLFCDVFGNPKNISAMPSYIERAFNEGVGINPMGIDGFKEESRNSFRGGYEKYLEKCSEEGCRRRY